MASRREDYYARERLVQDCKHNKYAPASSNKSFNVTLPKINVNKQLATHFERPTFTKMPRSYEPATYQTKDVQKEYLKENDESGTPLLVKCKSNCTLYHLYI